MITVFALLSFGEADNSERPITFFLFFLKRKQSISRVSLHKGESTPFLSLLKRGEGRSDGKRRFAFSSRRIEAVAMYHAARMHMWLGADERV